MLRIFTKEHKQWDLQLNELGFAINTAQSESTGVAPCEVMFGRMLKRPWGAGNDQPLQVTLPADSDLKLFVTTLVNRLAAACQFVKENLA